ncbi:MAG TPA: DUF4398 domain-containing protein [Rhodanobacteraceae bacterium]
MTRTRRKIHDLRLLGLAVLVASLAGCATAPPPIQMMDRAQAEIRAARSAGAATTAPEALAEAERRLAAAQQFSVNNNNGKAADKAAEAEAAAATARARADATRLDRQIEQQTQVNAGLQADLERRQAAAAAAQQNVSAPPASGSSAGGVAPVTLPPIQLGQPAPGSSAGQPAPASTDGQPGVYP